jgi:hypothetical protein
MILKVRGVDERQHDGGKIYQIKMDSYGYRREKRPSLLSKVKQNDKVIIRCYDTHTSTKTHVFTLQRKWSLVPY